MSHIGNYKAAVLLIAFLLITLVSGAGAKAAGSMASFFSNQKGRHSAKTTLLFILLAIAITTIAIVANANDLNCLIACNSDANCNDSNPNTMDVCNNDATCTAECTHLPKEEKAAIIENVAESPAGTNDAIEIIENAAEQETEGETVGEQEAEGEVVGEQETGAVEEPDNYPLELASGRKNFKLGEAPAFKFRPKKNFAETIGAGILDKDIEIIAAVSGLDIAPNVNYLENGEFSIELPESENIRQFEPGKYKMKIEVKYHGRVFAQEQEFTWGVLAINTNKSIYLPNEAAYLQMAVLGDDGHTICGASLRLEIKNQESETKVLSTEDGTIQYSGECYANNITDVPDYFAYYQIGGAGHYEVKLTNLDNGYEILDSFEAKDFVPFEVERTGPTRIYPPATYEMKFKIKANQDFAGKIIEQLPISFETGQEAAIGANEKTKEIIWEVDWKAGETYELKYQFKAPEISPQLYLLGPLRIGNFQEARQWQIAADSTGIPTFVNCGAYADATTAITPALPASIATNDILLMFLETANQGVGIANANGGTWAEVADSPQGTGTAAGTSATNLAVYWSRYNGTQTAPDTNDSGNHQNGVICAWRGVISKGDPWDVTSGGIEATSDTSWSITGDTTTVPNTLVVIAGARMDDNLVAHFDHWANANLANVTERADGGGAGGNGGGTGIADGQKAAIGSYAATTVDNTTTTVKGFITIALKPNTMPDANIWKVDNWDFNADLPVFRYNTDGNLTIKFTVRDADGVQDLNAGMWYSTTKGAKTTQILQDINLSTNTGLGRCDTNSKTDGMVCQWDWNISGIADNNYWITMEINDKSDTNTITAVRSFRIKPSAMPDANIWKVDNYDFNADLPVFRYSTDGNLTIKFRVKNTVPDDLNFNMWYSTTIGTKTNTIISDLNLSTTTGFGNCDSNSKTTGIVCSYDWNISGIADNNYWITIEIKDWGTDTNTTIASKSFRIKTNMAPDANIWKADNWDFNADLPVFRYNTDGNLTIKFIARDTNGAQDLNFNMWYSTTQGAKTNTIISDLNLSTTIGFGNCDSNDRITGMVCSYDWNISGIADNNYWITTEINDSRDTNTTTAIKSFRVKPSAMPDVNIWKVDNWDFNAALPAFRYVTDGNLAIKFWVKSTVPDDLNFNMWHSAVYGAKTNLIVGDINLSTTTGFGNCDTNSKISGMVCSYDWNISGIADNNYWITIEIKDWGSDSNTVTASKSFRVKPSAMPDVNIWKVDNWDFNAALPAFRYSTDGNLAIKFWAKNTVPDDLNFNMWHSAVYGAKTNLIVGDINLNTTPGYGNCDTNSKISGMVCSYDWNIMGIADNNYWITIEIKDWGTDTNTTTAAKSFRVNPFTNTAPDANIWKVDNYDLNGALKKFSYAVDGNLAIKFRASDPNGTQDLNFNMWYGATASAKTTVVIRDINLSTDLGHGACDTNSKTVGMVCSWDWNISGITDGNYWITVEINDGTDSNTVSTQRSFRINNTKPDANIWMVDNYDLNAALPSFSYSADGNLAIKFRVSDAGGDDLNFNMWYGATASAKTTVVIRDINLSTDLGHGACDTNAKSGMVCQWDWNIFGVSDANYWVTIEVNDGTDSNTATTQRSFRVNPTLNVAPDANIWKVDNYDLNGALKKFSYAVDGNLTVKFRTSDPNGTQDLNFNMWYGTSANAKTAVIVRDINLSTDLGHGACDTNAKSGMVCQWDWNIFGVSDANYWVTIEVNDGTDSNTATTQRSFWVNPTPNVAPDANIWKVDGFDLNAALPSFSYAADGNLAVKFRVSDSTGSQDLNFNMWYGASANAKTTVIIRDINLSTDLGHGACDTNSKIAGMVCSWDWNISGITDGNYWITVEINDGTDSNTATTQRSFMVDNTAPTTTPDYNSGWQGASANATFSCSDAGSGCSITRIRKDGDSASVVSLGSVISGSAPDLNAFFSEDGNWAVDFNSSDSAGNTGQSGRIYVLIDKTGPSVGATTLTGFTTSGSFINGIGTVVGGTSFDLNSGIDNTSCQYTADGSSWLAASWNADHCEKTGVSISNGVSYAFNTRVSDSLANVGTGTATGSYTGDTVAPATSDDHNAGWQNTDANVHLTCSDGTGSGCAATRYRIDSGAWQLYDNNILFSSDGNFQVDYNSTDNVNNVEATRAFWVTVDKTVPSLSNVYPSVAVPNGADNTPSFWVKVTDATSGAKGCYYKTFLNNITWSALAYTDKNGSDYCNYTSSALNSNDTLLVEWMGVDNADNNSTDQNTGLYTYTLVLGNYPPVLDINAVDGYADAPGFPVFRYFSDLNLTIDFNIFDIDNNRLAIDLNYSPSNIEGAGTAIVADLNLDSSYCIGLEFSRPEGTKCSYDFNIHASLVSDGNYYITGSLGDGTYSDFDSTQKSFMIDNTAPTTIPDYNSGWQGASANVTFSCSDAGSGCGITRIRKDSDSAGAVSLGSVISGSAPDLNAFFSGDGNWAVDFNSSDSAGNIEQSGRVFVLIDKTAPNASAAVPAAPAETTASTYTVTVDVNDALSGILICDLNIYRADTNAVVESQSVSPSAGKCSYSFTFGATDINYFAAWKVFDYAGNTASDINSSFVFKKYQAPADTGGETGAGKGLTGGGGGGGGGAAAVSISVAGWGFDRVAEVGKAASIKINLYNEGAQSPEVFVSVEITRAGNPEFSAKESAGKLGKGETKEVILTNQWVPGMVGIYSIEIKLLSGDGKTVFGKLAESFSIAGELRYDVAIECLEKVVRPGDDVSASIKLLNLGDYYQDVDLSWRIEDQNKNVAGIGSMPIALKPLESRGLVRAVRVPEDSMQGLYHFYAEVSYVSEKRTGSCTFSVAKGADYYTLRLDFIEEWLDELDSAVESKKIQGMDTAEIEQKIGAERRAIARARDKVAIREFTGLDEELARIEDEIERLFREAEVLKPVFPGMLFGFVFLAAFLIFLFGILLLLILLIARYLVRHYSKARKKIILEQFRLLEEKNLAIKKSFNRSGREAKKIFASVSGFLLSIASLVKDILSLAGPLASLVLALVKGVPSRFKRKVLIEGWSFEKEPVVGQKANLKIMVSGTGLAGQNLLVSAEILHADEIEFTSSEIVEGSKLEESREVALSKQWIPRIAGAHEIEINVIDADSVETHQNLIKTFEVAGELRYGISVECLEKTLKPGNAINSLIVLSNRGHYERGVVLRWWLEGPNAGIIKGGGTVVALEPGESRNILRKAFIPADAQAGTYRFNAEVDYELEKKSASCAFSVEAIAPSQAIGLKGFGGVSVAQYHTLMIDSLLKKLDDLASILLEKKSNGIYVGDFERKTRDIKGRIERARRMIDMRRFRDLDKVIVDRLEKEIDALTEEASDLEKTD